MWDGAVIIIRKIRQRRAQRVTCDSKIKGTTICRTGKIRVPGNLYGKRVFVVLSEELNEIEQYLSSMTALRRFFSALLNSRKGSKMFNIVGETWNPVTGCAHNCIYCWARKLAMTKLRNSKRYRNGFIPRLNPEEFKKTFKGGVVFVSDMGDLFGAQVKKEWIIKVIEYVKKFPDTYFLFLTKNPSRYHEFLHLFPENAILGATIETNRDDLILKYHISLAPLPSIRYEAMKKLKWDLKFVSIEPILDFDLEEFVKWIKDINPFMVYVGYDNYNNKLPEPSLKKTQALIRRLEEFTLVIKKTIRPAWNESLGKFIENNSKGKRG